MSRIVIVLSLVMLLCSSVLEAAASSKHLPTYSIATKASRDGSHHGAGGHVDAEKKGKHKQRKNRKKNKKNRRELKCFAQKGTVRARGTGLTEGTPDANVIIGDAADNSIRGNGGLDRICAGAGDDFVVGIAGQVVTEAMLVNGGSGDDSISTGSGNDTLLGEEGDDSLSAGDGNNVLFGGDGVDDLLSRHGDDKLTGGAGDDRLDGGGGTDYLDGGPGDDLIFAIVGNGGPAPEGEDTVLGGDGDDAVVAEDGAHDVVDCGPGNDTVSFDVGLDEISNCEIENPDN